MPLAMYEHPLIFGAREYFLSDEQFHDLCIGDEIADSDFDESCDEETNPPQKKCVTSASTQTEPWAGAQDDRRAPATRLVRVLPGMTRPCA